MKIKLDPGAYAPARAHDTDAGIDLYAERTAVIMGHDSAVFDTGVHAQLPPGTVGFLKSKSGLMVRDITSDGVIDEWYSGGIKVKKERCLIRTMGFCAHWEKRLTAAIRQLTES